MVKKGAERIPGVAFVSLAGLDDVPAYERSRGFYKHLTRHPPNYFLFPRHRAILLIEQMFAYPLR
jgi:hypothetical protein